MRLASFLAAGLIVGGSFAGGVANANSIIPPPWQSVVAYARFVGVVRCETAGGIVARYRVIDSWKGPKNGSELLIGRHADVFGAYYPVSLVGESYFLAADMPCGRWSMPPKPGLDWGFVPLWWRQITPELYADWYAAKLPFGPEAGRGIQSLQVPESRAPLDSFKVEVLRFLQRDERRLELEALRASARFHYLWDQGSTDSILPPCETATCLATSSDSLEKGVASLLDTFSKEILRGHLSANQVLWDGGGRVTLQRLSQEGQEATGLLELIRTKIRCRLGLGIPDPEPARYASSIEDGKTRRRLLQALGRGVPREWKPRQEFEEAFIRLTEAEPESVTNFLIHCTLSDQNLGYVLGSYFATRCPSDRVRRMRALLKATEPYIRVSAAVYLMFEEPREGESSLRSLSALDGDPGAWAALTLARRGRKESLSRALEVLREPGGVTMSGWSHQVLQARVMELLSNSAAASGLQLPIDWNPDVDREMDTMPIYDELSAWWQVNADRITLGDPWLEMLAAKKID